MKKRRNAGKKGTKWQCSGRRSKNWTEPWNEEGRRKLLKFGCHAKKVLELVVNERMSQDKKGDKSQRERRKYQDGLSKRCRKSQMLLWRKTLKK